jgi:COMPASS component SWD2
MLINDTNVKSFRMTKIFRENTERINACDFNKNGLSNFFLFDFFILLTFLLGDLLISSSDDDTIVVYDCEAGL